MAYQLITCPESAHLEMIEFETSRFGMLIVSCSGFQGDCTNPSVCPRTCAQRQDRRDRGKPFLIAVKSLLRTSG